MEFLLSTATFYTYSFALFFLSQEQFYLSFKEKLQSKLAVNLSSFPEEDGEDRESKPCI